MQKTREGKGSTHTHQSKYISEKKKRREKGVIGGRFALNRHDAHLVQQGFVLDS